MFQNTRPNARENTRARKGLALMRFFLFLELFLELRVGLLKIMNLPKTKLSGYNDQLVKLITWLDDSIGGAHDNWKEARANHDRV
jgi:hypothetical protein